MDFVSDALFDGRRLRALTVVNTYTRERLAGQDQGGQWLAGLKKRIGVGFFRLGKSTDNAKIESFNGRLREECLKARWFLSLEDAKRKIEAWRRYYNEARPHTALDWAKPAEFARQCGLQPELTATEEPEISTSARD